MSELPPITRDNQWTCRLCGKRWVIPDFARTCEKKHADGHR